MNISVLKNKKTIIALGIALLIFLIITAMLVLKPESNDGNGNNVTRPTPFQSSQKSTEELNKDWVKLPVSDNDPRLWIDKNGNRIKPDTSGE